MAETSGFFDAEELVGGGYDREYVAEQWANYFKLFISNGVFVTPTNQLKVVANSGMTIKVRAGWAWINGYWYNNGADLTMTVPANTSAGTKKHGIFVQYDSGNRTIKLVVGNERTTVNRTSPYYELKLAEITVAPGTSAITDAMITDTRSNSSVCGFVTGVVNVIDSTDLFNQFTAIFNNFLASAQAYETEHQEEFEEWFEHMKDQLSTDAAGHLQLEIDNLTNKTSVLGAKNLLPFDLATVRAINTAGTWRGNAYTHNGVTFTPTFDSKGNLLYIDTDGKATPSQALFYISSALTGDSVSLPSGNYIANGCPVGGANGTYKLDYAYRRSGATIYNTDYGSGVDLALENDDKLHCYITVANNYITSHLRFYPQIRLATDTDSTYQPYSMTNRQLTTDKVDHSTLGEVGAVNLAPNDLNPFTLGSLSVAVNADKSITINGSTPDTLGIQVAYVEHLLGKTVKLYNPEGDNNNVYLDLSYEYNGSVVTKTPTDGAFTIPSDAGEPAISLMIQGGVTYNAFKFYPMVTPPEYNGPYAPYAMTNQQLTADKVGMDSFREAGAVNYFNPSSLSGNNRGIVYSSVDGVYSVSGTQNGDGSGTYITLGTFVGDGKTYKLTGCPSSRQGCNLNVQDAETMSSNSDFGEGVEFTAISGRTYNMIIYVPRNKALSGTLTFKPMISLALFNLSYDDYVPYAKTNRELTDIVDPLKVQFDADHNIVKIIREAMNIYWTDNAFPSDWSNLTTQQATDMAQALYDIFKKIGGVGNVRYTGLVVQYHKKASDSSQLSSTTTMTDIYSTGHYSTMLSNNSNARFTMVVHPYGNAQQTIFALWGQKIMISQHGIDASGSVTDFDKIYTYNTISTYKG